MIPGVPAGRDRSRTTEGRFVHRGRGAPGRRVRADGSRVSTGLRPCARRPGRRSSRRWASSGTPPTARGGPLRNGSFLCAAIWPHCLAAAGVRPPEVWRGDGQLARGSRAGLRIAADPLITSVCCANAKRPSGSSARCTRAAGGYPRPSRSSGSTTGCESGSPCPPLATVKQDFHRIGHELVQLVLDR